MLAVATSRTGVAATVASALRWVGRGQTYPALCREIAWTAARAVEAGRSDLEWLSPLIDAELGDRFDELPRVALDAAVLARAEHLHRRPHDHAGADLVADLAAHDAAVEHLSVAYMDVLDWGVGILRERQEKARRDGTRRLRRSGKPPADTGAQCEVPQRILDGLTLRSERPGWPDRRAA